MLNVELRDYFAVLDALIASGAMTADETSDRRKVSQAIGDVIATWAAIWATERAK